MSHKFCVIFDLDDTLSDCQWRAPLLEPLPGEKKKNWPAFFSACGQDPERERLVELARAFVEGGAHLIIFTGRQEKYKAMSIDWLSQRGLVAKRARFRPDHIFKPDHTLKDDWTARLKADGFEPVAAFDDRDANVEVFRRHGILSANALNLDEVELVAEQGLALLAQKMASLTAPPRPPQP